VIGGFSVIYHGHVRATKDSDLLVPDGPEADEAVMRFLQRIAGKRIHDEKGLSLEDVQAAETVLRIKSKHGAIDIMRGGLPPLDFDTVFERAEIVDWDGQEVRFASLESVVGFKRLAGRPQDGVDLAELEAIHGPLPTEPIPGLDS
jgi:hypothetical protein